jgi:hypothetical protein
LEVGGRHSEHYGRMQNLEIEPPLRLGKMQLLAKSRQMLGHKSLFCAHALNGNCDLRRKLSVSA